MSFAIDETHDPARTSWVASANEGSDFPIQNLPFGVFAPRDGPARGGVAIGDLIVDLAAGLQAELFTGDAIVAARAACASTLNGLMALDSGPRADLRRQLSGLLSSEFRRSEVEAILHSAAECRLHVPSAIGDYTDFFAGIHHAVNAGRQLRGVAEPPANYKYMPIAYHGRASSIRASGVPVRRPMGQVMAQADAGPLVMPSAALDFELELGIWLGGGNRLGEPIPIDRAAESIVGLCLFNDWSARDIQRWEAQPLGPFQGKNFMSTVSPWVITSEALSPFRIAQPARPPGDPPPLPHLWNAADQASGAFALDLEVSLTTSSMRARGHAPHVISRTAASNLYWTAAQMVAHHTFGGCDLRAGDLFGTGTISGPDGIGLGSLLEITEGGTRPIQLPNGEERTYLQDGDELSLSGKAKAQGFVTIGFGECRGVVWPATTL